MQVFVAVVSSILIVIVLWDVFETIVLPRRVTRRLRPTWIVYRFTWVPWSALARRMPGDNNREEFLSYYGPLALLVLLAIWALALVVGFAGVHWGLGPTLTGSDIFGRLSTDLYFSATTFI